MRQHTPTPPVAAVPIAAATLDFRAGFWRLADPKISLASIASIVLGTAAAFHDGPLAAGWALLTLLGIFAIEVAKNASGDIYDFDSGCDLAVTPDRRSPFSGGKRVLVDGLLTRRQTWGIAVGGYLIGAAIGVGIVLARAPQVFWLGLAGMALAFCYQGPPFRLSYRGFGELAVALAYGPLVCVGTYTVQRGTLPRWVLLLSIPLGLLIAAFLWANEFPDYEADRSANKRTLVVRLGRARAAAGFAVLVGAAFALTLALPFLGAPRGVLLGLAALFPAAQAARALVAHPDDMAHIVPAQAKTLLSFLVFAVGAGVGLVIGR